MCLYPKLIRNRKYTVTKKNRGNVPTATDDRVLLVAVGCGKCIECRKQKSNNWKVRLHEEIRYHQREKMWFITLTFNNESFKKLAHENKQFKGYDLDNAIATTATRKFLERWRKKHKKSVKHWFITELGKINLEHIHLHGIIFTDKPEEIENTWSYGWVYIDQRPVTERTINYIVKYITKTDAKHKYYNPKVLTSPGIGANYIKRTDARLNKFKPGETNEVYTTRTGNKIGLPIYYRNKIYNEDEREKLWIEKLDKEIRWIRGEKIDISKGLDIYFKCLEYHRKINERLGYGSDQKEWNRIKYENQLRAIKHMEKSKTNEETPIHMDYNNSNNNDTQQQKIFNDIPGLEAREDKRNLNGFD